jgi:hypothetical protein
LSKIDSLLGRPYSYASHTIHLRGDMRRNTAVHLKVTVFQSGLVALDISVPEYQFNEQVVLGAKREPIANAPGPQGDGVPDARWQGRLGSAVDGLPSMTA